MSWRLLSPAMQRAVFDLGWQSLWPLQEEAIAAVLQTTGNVLMVGDTASGKTEGAFLPLLSLPLAPAGFTTLYVSPLRALLNDQGERLRVLGAYTGTPVHLWHSDVPQGRKRQSQAEPLGILLTTPESLEAICVHRALYLRPFFRALRFVVVDELHAFLGVSRGVQLSSLLRRIERYCTARPRRIGLSATIGDRGAAQRFLGEPCVVCAGPGPRKATRLRLLYAPEGGVERQSLALTSGRKALIFCNTRARVEELTHRLNRLAGHEDAYLPHHGSLDRRERVYAETSLRAAPAASVVCTSTLELGIDVGAVDLVLQINCTHSVASLRQRLGRSGRGPGQARTGALFATDEAELLQAVAVVELLRRGWVEPPADPGPAYDVLWQQALSEAVERGGLAEADLAAYPTELVSHMLAHDHLTRAGDRLIAGLEGERLAHRRDFYAAFETEDAYEVAAGPRLLGRLPPLPIYTPGTPIIFAGRVWTVREVDHTRRRIEVEPGAEGHPPVFTSSPARVDGQVRDEMVRVLLSDADYAYLDGGGRETLAGLREQYRQLGLTETDRPWAVTRGLSVWHAFAGDRVAATLALVLQLESRLVWEVTPFGGLEAPAGWPALPAVLERYGSAPPPAPKLQARLMELVPDRALRLPKFGRHLPPALQREIHAARELDVPGALGLLAARIQARRG